MTMTTQESRIQSTHPGQPESSGQSQTARSAADTVDSLPGRESAGRVLMYSHDTYGLGHFRRCLKIAREMRRQSANVSVLMLTGSPLAHQFSIPDGVDFVKLPSVIKAGKDEYHPRALNMSIHDLVTLRARIIRETTLAFHPDAVLVDHAPLGLCNEALLALESLWEQSSRPAMILGLRDIIDDRERVVDSWRQSGMYHAIDRFFDRVVIYGVQSVYDTCAEYEFPESLKSKASYAGFISGSDGDQSRSDTYDAARRPMVLVTVGGGEDGGRIVDAYSDMLREHRHELAFDSIILPGPLLSAERVNEIRADLAGLPAEVHHFVNGMAPLLSQAALVISMGGYNAAAEIMAHANRALLIPREWPRCEQLIRAEQLATRGCATVLRLGDLTADSMWENVLAILASTDAPLAKLRSANEFTLNGAAVVASAVLHAARRSQNKESNR